MYPLGILKGRYLADLRQSNDKDAWATLGILSEDTPSQTHAV